MSTSQLQQPNRFQHGPAEEHEPLAVVAIIFSLVRDTARGDRSSRPAPRGTRARWNRASVDRSNWPRTILLPMGTSNLTLVGSSGWPHWRDERNAGMHDGTFWSKPREFDGQGAANVGQPAGLGEGHHFTAGQKDIQGTGSPLMGPTTKPAHNGCPVNLARFCRICGGGTQCTHHAPRDEIGFCNEVQSKHLCCRAFSSRWKRDEYIASRKKVPRPNYPSTEAVVCWYRHAGGIRLILASSIKPPAQPLSYGSITMLGSTSKRTRWDLNPHPAARDEDLDPAISTNPELGVRN